MTDQHDDPLALIEQFTITAHVDGKPERMLVMKERETLALRTAVEAQHSREREQAAEIERLRSALKVFADCCEYIDSDEDDEEWAKFRLLIKNYREAEAALNESPRQSVAEIKHEGWCDGRNEGYAARDNEGFEAQCEIEARALERLLPAHKAGLSFEHNQHRNVYEKAYDWIAENEWCEWESDEAKQQAIETDEIWTLQWYPDTPVGFYAIAAPTAADLLRQVREHETDRIRKEAQNPNKEQANE